MTSKTKKKHKMTCYEFKVNGMHCASCELTVERKLKKFKGIKSVYANLDTGLVKVEGKFEDDPEKLAEKFSKMLEKEGYSIGREVTTDYKNRDIKDYIIAIAIALAVMLAYFLFQNSGLVSLSFDELNYSTYFLIGLLASCSSCAAVVGGLLLSISANDAKEERKISSEYRNQIIFHISRLLAFFLLGGLLGVIGSKFSLEYVVSGILGLITGSFIYRRLSRDEKISEIWNSLAFIASATISAFIYYFIMVTISQSINLPINLLAQFILSVVIVIIMFVLALNLLDIFDFTNKLQFKLPKSLSRFLLRSENIDNVFGPILLGIVTFFLPCGFTQAMQVQALNSQSFWEGATIMSLFALGTLPALALISFASINLGENIRTSKLFFKVSGFLVLFFGLYNLISAFIVIGVLPPILPI